MLTRLRKVLNQTRTGNQISHDHFAKYRNAKKSLRHGPTTSSASLVAIAVSGVIFALALIAWPTLTAVLAADPGAGTLSPAGPSVTWNGLAVDYANPVSASEQNCQDGVNCDTFKLTLSGTPADWAGKLVHIQIDWLSSLHPNLVAQGDPPESLMRFKVLRQSFFDYPALAIREVTEGEAHVTIAYGMSARAEEAASWQTLGFFERLLEVAGAQDVKIGFTSASWEGAAETILSMHWR